MNNKQNILELRERLDKTLAMPDLVNEESIKSLVKDQLLHSSFCGNEGNIGKVVEKRAVEVSNFLDMLRSASTKDQKAVKNKLYNEWKIKQDTEQLRVMYREGPHGTPFHTLLAEGFADGPIDVCLCVSWEATLYKKWWPQYNIPTFKITMSDCLQKVCIGEEISLIRVKVAWPVSDRETLLHYFEIEYFKEDLLIVLLNTISDTEHIDVTTHGFTRDGIPEAKDTIRIDLVGGFVLQKVDSNRSYFRAIANMDIKLDFVPPTLINFIARQLIGNAHKLYQKAVGSVATRDEDYRQALQGPLYARIREGLDSGNKLKTTFLGPDEEKHRAAPPEGHRDSDTSSVEIRPVTEIVEEETEQNSDSSLINQLQPTEEHMSKENSFINPEKQGNSSSANIFISPEVECALRMLDQAISVVRGRGFSDRNQSNCFSVSQETPTSEAVPDSCLTSSEKVPKNSAKNGTRSSKREPSLSVSADAEDFRNNAMDSAPKEGDNDDSREFTFFKERISFSHDKLTAEGAVTVTQPPVSESMRKVCDEESLVPNGFHGRGSHRGGKSKSKSSSKSSSKPGNKKKQGFPCCLNLGLLRS